MSIEEKTSASFHNLFREKVVKKILPYKRGKITIINILTIRCARLSSIDIVFFFWGGDHLRNDENGCKMDVNGRQRASTVDLNDFFWVFYFVSDLYTQVTKLFL